MKKKYWCPLCGFKQLPVDVQKVPADEPTEVRAETTVVIECKECGHTVSVVKEN